jgi:hypothetical protein
VWGASLLYFNGIHKQKLVLSSSSSITTASTSYACRLLSASDQQRRLIFRPESTESWCKVDIGRANRSFLTIVVFLYSRPSILGRLFCLFSVLSVPFIIFLGALMTSVVQLSGALGSQVGGDPWQREFRGDSDPPPPPVAGIKMRIAKRKSPVR